MWFLLSKHTSTVTQKLKISLNFRKNRLNITLHIKLETWRKISLCLIEKKCKSPSTKMRAKHKKGDIIATPVTCLAIASVQRRTISCYASLKNKKIIKFLPLNKMMNFFGKHLKNIFLLFLIWHPSLLSYPLPLLS